MTVIPLDFNYGLISLGCDNEERITIRNDGNLLLTVDSVTQMVTQPPEIIMDQYGLVKALRSQRPCSAHGFKKLRKSNFFLMFKPA